MTARMTIGLRAGRVRRARPPMTSRRTERMKVTLDVVLSAMAVIFDLDGVLVDSRAVVDQTWSEWALRRGLDAELVHRSIPGTRTRDAVLLLAPESDIDAEAAAIVEREKELVEHVVPVRGARSLLEQLPLGRWGIATSGTGPVARGRLAQAGMPVPDVFITAEMVAAGKPDPEVYRRAASALGVDPAACVVFEDAPSGIAAATAAGSTVVGVLTWAPPGLLKTPYAVQDLSNVCATVGESVIRLALRTSA